MTVQELIEELKKLPPYYQVVNIDTEPVMRAHTMQLHREIGPVVVIKTASEPLVERNY